MVCSAVPVKVAACASCRGDGVRLYAAFDPQMEAKMAGSANLNVMMKTARKAGRALLKDFGEV